MTLELFRGRSLLTWQDFDAADIRALLDLSKRVKAEARRGEVKQRFTGKTIALIFEKRSTRTRCAFETAFGEEGGHPVFLSTQDIQLGAKESVEDTARVLGRMFSAIQFRGFKQSVVETLAKKSGVPVFNGLTDQFHPTQALADIMTLEENAAGGAGGAGSESAGAEGAAGRKLVFCGDGRNNVARSLMVICAKLGVNFTVITPPELNPDPALVEICRPLARESGAAVEITANLDAVSGADALYTDVWASMGEEAIKEERTRLLAPFQVNQALMERTGRKDTIFLHCLPAIKGEEVTAGVIDGPQSRAWDQAENRKHTIKAIMLAMINGAA